MRLNEWNPRMFSEEFAYFIWCDVLFAQTRSWPTSLGRRIYRPNESAGLISGSLRSSAGSASLAVTVCKYKRAAGRPLLFLPVYPERAGVCAFVCIVSAVLSVRRKETRVSGFVNTWRLARVIMKCRDGIILLSCKCARARSCSSLKRKKD